MLTRAMVCALRWLLERLAPADVVTLAVPRDALLEQARVLTAAQTRIPDRSGEAKRHQVYAQLQKAFPDRLHRHLSHAIEAALEDA